MKISVLNANVGLGKRIKSYGQYRNLFNGNVGNSYITYSLLKRIRRPTQRVNFQYNNIWEDTYDPVSNENINNSDLAILILQDHIREGLDGGIFGNASKVISDIRIPLVIVSLGVNSVDGKAPDEIVKNLGTQQKLFFTLLGQKAHRIGVRGLASREALRALGITINVDVIGCPGFFENGNKVLLAKNEWDSEKEIVATGLFSSKYDLTFIMQDEKEEIDWLLFKQPYYFSRVANYPGWEESFKRSIASNNVLFFTSIEKWKKYIINNANIVIGTRVHGAAIAISAGVPAIITSGDLRSEEMAEYMHIPYRKGACGLDIDIRREHESYPYADMEDNYFTKYKIYRRFWKDLGVTA